MTVVQELLVAVRTAPDRRTIGRTLQKWLAMTGLLDVLMIAVAVLAALRLRLTVDDDWGFAPVGNNELTLRAGPVLLLVWLVAIIAQGGYSVRNFGSGSEEFRTVGRASFAAAGLVGLTCYTFDVPVSRGLLVMTFLIGTPLLVLERYAVRQTAHRLRRNGRLLHRVIAVGGPSGISEVVDALRRSRHIGYEVVGACLPDTITLEPARFAVPVLGRVADTRRMCDEMGADTVLVARGGFDSAQELRRIAWDLEGSSIDLVVVPSLTDVAGPRIHMRPVAGLPLLHVEQPQAGKAGGHSKRAFDLLLGTLALVLLLPLLLVVGMVVKGQDGGPVFFRQRRIGRDGAPFEMLKFRSMVMDAEERLDALRERNESDAVLFKMQQDPRITRAGRVLRRYSIDELPQIFNVLRGDMSLVGPRPPLPSEVDQYAVDVHRRLLVRPGLTGLWQVSGRSSLSWDEAVRLDLFYVDNWSMTSDLAIMVKTVKAVLGASGAY